MVRYQPADPLLKSTACPVHALTLYQKIIILYPEGGIICLSNRIPRSSDGDRSHITTNSSTMSLTFHTASSHSGGRALARPNQSVATQVLALTRPIPAPGPDPGIDWGEGEEEKREGEREEGRRIARKRECRQF